MSWSASSTRRSKRTASCAIRAPPNLRADLQRLKRDRDSGRKAAPAAVGACPHQVSRRASVCQSERGQGERVFQRRAGRGDHQRSHAAAGPAGDSAHFVILVPGQGGGRPRDRREAQCGEHPGRERAQGRQPDPRHRAAGERGRRLSPLVGALRPRDDGRVRHPGRDLPGDRRQAARRSWRPAARWSSATRRTWKPTTCT